MTDELSPAENAAADALRKKGSLGSLEGWQYEYDEVARTAVRAAESVWEQEKLWECPRCGFTFSTIHTNADGTYTCPQCEAGDLEKELADLRAAWDGTGVFGEHYAETLQELADLRAEFARMEDAWREKLVEARNERPEPVRTQLIHKAQYDAVVDELAEARAEIERLKECLEPGKASAIVNAQHELAQQFGYSPLSSEGPLTFFHKKLTELDRLKAAVNGGDFVSRSDYNLLAAAHTDLKKRINNLADEVSSIATTEDAVIFPQDVEERLREIANG